MENILHSCNGRLIRRERKIDDYESLVYLTCENNSNEIICSNYECNEVCVVFSNNLILEINSYIDDISNILDENGCKNILIYLRNEVIHDNIKNKFERKFFVPRIS